MSLSQIVKRRLKSQPPVQQRATPAGAAVQQHVSPNAELTSLGFSLPPEAAPDAPATLRSLFGEILDWMLAPLLLLWPLSIAVTYLVAKAIANGPYDRALETSVVVLTQQVKEVNGRVALQLPISAREILRADETDNVYYQVLGGRGEFISGDRDLPLPHEEDKPQMGVVQFRDEKVGGNEVRIAYTHVDMKTANMPRPVLVQVAETLDKRAQLANEIIKGVILPQFVILPLAVILVWFGLTRGLAPLTALQRRMRRRNPDDTSPIDESAVPQEIMPLVASFNDLLAQLEQSVEVQKRFIADAAHQMKTPLAGLALQAELAQREQSPDELRRSLVQIGESSQRATHLVKQLLSLARTERQAGAAIDMEKMDLSLLCRSLVQEWLQAAWAKKIDLGLEEPGHAVMILGNPLMLREMLSNLIDNAIRYTSAQGQVTVRIETDNEERFVFLDVDDTGPGIPSAERPHVFERFYRILGSTAEGSGLGLAIVKEIAQQHGAEISILDNVYSLEPRQAGTRFRIMLKQSEAEA